MTTIAFRDGVLASECRINMCDAHWAMGEKIAKAPDGSLVGAAGHFAAITAVLDWARKGFRKSFNPDPDWGDWDAFVARTDGTFYVYEAKGHFPVFGDFFSIGTGSQFAMGAMAAGASAEQAVKIATDYDNCSGGPVRVLKLGKKV